MKLFVFIALFVFSVSVQASLPEVSFSKSSVASKEGRTVDVELTLSEPTVLGVSLQIEVLDGSASQADHNLGEDLNVHIAPGQSSAIISFEILNDSEEEGLESFKLRLTAPQNAVLGNQKELDIYFEDNLSGELPVVEFLLSVSTGSENQTVSVIAKLSQPASSYISVPLKVSGTATSFQDHDLPEFSELIFNPGQTEITLTVNLINDYTNETNEQIVITMRGPVNDARIGSQRQHIITILGNLK